MKSRDHTFAFLVLVAVTLPVFAGVGYSFFASLSTVGAGATGVTMRAFVAVFTDSATWRSVAWSVVTAALATAVAATMAVQLVARISRSHAMLRVLLVPLAVPHVAAALAFLFLMSQSGLISRVAFAFGWIGASAGFPILVGDKTGIGLMCSYVWKEFPFLLIVAMGAAAQGLDDVIESARTLGAGRRDVRRRIVVPLLARSVAPAAAAAFVYLLGQYEMAALLAPTSPQALPLLTLERWYDPMLERRSEAHVLGLIAMTLAAAAVWWQMRLRRALADE